MAKYLVIVESPAKVKTIKKFLGANYEVEASNGHVRDFPKSQFGIDVENDFEPKYITIRGKGELLAKLRKAAKKADKIYLATDPDREGEAISWHLMQALKEDPDKMHRITFNEITKLEKNGMFVYESVPGTAVHGFKADENDVTFVVEGPENASITLELEPETEYKVHVDDVYVGKNKTNLGGKMSISVDLEEGRPVKVDVKRAFD